MKAILILDDDKAVRESLADFFEDRGWHVLQAASGESAINVLEKETPHGALVDIRLPGMDGNAFIRKAHAIHPQLVFIIVTGSPEYAPPGDIHSLPHVSQKVFSKPIFDLVTLEEAMLQQMERAKD